eukprot:gene33391-37733_t
MIQVTPHMRILVAVEPINFRAGIDAVAGLCRRQLAADPFSGALFIFTNRRRRAIKILIYHGNGFWLCQKRLSSGCFAFWPLYVLGLMGVTRRMSHFDDPSLQIWFQIAAVGAVMIAGGIGNISGQHAHKNDIPVGSLLIQLGGPGMRIGMGGSAASSMATGTNTADLDFDSVQRGNPEMERRAQE